MGGQGDNCGFATVEWAVLAGWMGVAGWLDDLCVACSVGRWRWIAWIGGWMHGLVSDRRDRLITVCLGGLAAGIQALGQE